MNEIHDSVSYRMEELRSKVNTLINCDIASSTKSGAIYTFHVLFFYF